MSSGSAASDTAVRPGPDESDGADESDPEKAAVLGRYLGEEDPENMSRRTGLIRAAVREQRERDRKEARKRTRRFQVAAAALLLVAAGAGVFAYLTHRRAERQAATAAELFHTMKSLELELARLRGETGADAAFRARLRELDRQYDELVRTLGIYDEDTPEEVRLVYRIVHGFGESEVEVPEEFVQEVLRYTELWKRSRLPRFIERARRNDYGRRIARTMLDRGLPPEFFYLALQESGLDTAAVGPPTRFGHAKGMWQFIPQTAENYGLETGPLRGEPRPDPLDDRHDFEKSTRAAARYLYDIYTTDAQASGLLVMASYNWGEHNVLRLIRSMPPNPRERNFWTLLERHRERLPEETYDYVLRIVSAAVIGENPRLFGFDFDPPLPEDLDGGGPATAPAGAGAPTAPVE